MKLLKNSHLIFKKLLLLLVLSCVVVHLYYVTYVVLSYTAVAMACGHESIAEYCCDAEDDIYPTRRERVSLELQACLDYGIFYKAGEGCNKATKFSLSWVG